MAITHINFSAIPVVDQDRALAFYRDALGFSVQVDAPYRDGWRWIFMTLPGSQCRLHFSAKDEIQVRPDLPALTLVCESVDDEAARLRAAGVKIEAGPDDAPWAASVRWLLLRDSEENLVLIESLKTA